MRVRSLLPFLLAASLVPLLVSPAQAAPTSVDLGVLRVHDGKAIADVPVHAWLIRGAAPYRFTVGWRFDDDGSSNLTAGYGAEFQLEVSTLLPGNVTGALLGRDVAKPTASVVPFDRWGTLSVALEKAPHTLRFNMRAVPHKPGTPDQWAVRYGIGHIPPSPVPTTIPPLPPPPRQARLTPALQDPVVACHRDLFNPFGDLTDADVCRELNGAAGDCQENGDCACDSQHPLVELEKDTDHDGVPDSRDPDIDCDHLSNDLESMIPLPQDEKNDPFDMRPLDDAGIRIRVGIASLHTSGDMDGVGGGADDPYANLSSLGWRGPTATDMVLDFPGFDKAHHPSNTNDVTFGLNDGWSTASQTSQALNSSYADLSTWTYRQDGDPAGLPLLHLRLPVYDDDHGESTDDSYGTPADVVGDLMQLAGKVGSAWHPLGQAARIADGTHWADVSVQLSADVCPASVAWANLVATGKYNVDPSDLPVKVIANAC